MNILPKKSWHVRNRDNIARVRKDEAEAAKKEEEIEARKRLAEQEAKIEFMRKRTREKYGVLITKIEPVSEPVNSSKLEHVNFFRDLEEGAVVSNAKNKDHELEMTEEREKYEKQIGYLTYLGQDTNEAGGKVSWYERSRSDLLCNDEDVEKDIKKKNVLDPIFKYKYFFDQHRFTSKPQCKESEFADICEVSLKKSKNKKKHKKATKHRSYHKNEKIGSSRSSSSDKEDQKIKEQRLQILREKRLKRETGERIRAAKLLAKMRGEVVEEPVKEPPMFIQKYNTQFNPHLAKQNVTK